MDNIVQGELVLLQKSVGTNSNGNIVGKWRCFCGVVFEAPNTRVINGYKDSCGCLTRQKRRSNVIHNMRNSPEYRSWSAAKNRCQNPNSKDYQKYGGRGICFHKPWAESFKSFYDYMGPRPRGHSLDRIDNSKGYLPGNVRWASSRTQQRNRRSSLVWKIKGQTFETAEEAAKHFNVSKQTVWKWVNGYFDKRRSKLTAPKEDCYAVQRY